MAGNARRIASSGGAPHSGRPAGGEAQKPRVLLAWPERRHGR
jgi:hypothetical protein